MGPALHFILLFSGLWAFAFCTSRQFYVVDTAMKWDEAQKQCREKYTDLATVENDEEMNTIKDLLKKKNGKFWIGLRKNQTSRGNYENKPWFWSDGTPYNNYSYWDSQEPNYGDPNDYCVELYDGNNKWNDADCNHENSFICNKKRTPLKVIKEKKTWREALRFCRQHHVDLVSVYSQEIQDWVEEVTKKVSANMWIGLRHTRALGFWYWVRGEMICYQNWAPGNGTGVEDCGDVERTGAVLSDSKKWVSLPETQELYFICITF